ncbi:MAG TPA: glycosyltransferase family 4 protein [Acidimicrobiales bacterium]|nr:glycosyltransferase family 4 protein [Acidimicrobiales bacterium]
MRIGLVCPYSLTIPGGVQGQVLGLARALRGHGHEVRVLGPCDGPPPDAGVTPLGKSVPLAANGSIAPIAPDVPAALRTIRVLRDEAFDVLHLHEPLVPGPCMWSGLIKPAPIVATFHAAGVSAPYRLFGAALKILTNRIDVRCAVSEDAVELAGRYFGGVYEMVFNGIEVERFSKASPWERDERPTILFVGRHEERKGLAVLLGALDRLPADVRIWVGGEGPETAELRASFTDGRVEWLGRIDDEEKCRRLRAADVFCAPSIRGESFGIVLLEAMAAGTPVVASDLPGYAKVGRQGREALLVPPGDAVALAAALNRVLGESSFAGRLVEHGRARADELSMDRLAEVYLEKYERVSLARR